VELIRLAEGRVQMRPFANKAMVMINLPEQLSASQE
jgi:hypothetical protein